MLFHPADALLFRDGRPFNQSDEGLAEARSQFPPTPRTMVGAVRAALAFGKGWTKGNWANRSAEFVNGIDRNSTSTMLCNELGDRDTLGSLRVSGPFLVRRSNSGDFEPYFPMPHHILRSSVLTLDDWEKKRNTSDAVALTRLRPDGAFATDIACKNHVALPSTGLAKGTKWESCESFWISTQGFDLAMQPAGTIRYDALRPLLRKKHGLAAFEIRVGLQREEKGNTHRAENGMLYTAARVRLAEDVAIAVEIDGIDGFDETWPLPRLAPLGGEGRFAHVEWVKKPLDIPDPNAAKADGNYVVVLLTPARFDAAPKPGHSFTDLPGTLVTMAENRAGLVGGWRAGEGPLPFKPILPAGTTFFMKHSGPAAFAADARIGVERAWGYGRFAVGPWPREEKTT